MTNEAKVNYTEAQAASMIEAYQANPSRETVKMLAETLGKSERSVIAKLARLGVYQKAEYVGKNGERPAKKDAMVGEIAEAMSVNEDALEGLEKAPKNVLKLILAAVKH